MAVYGYTRVSTAEQAADDRTSLETQRERIGQAAAAIFAQTAPGKTRDEIELAVTEIETWLAGGPLPDWPGMAAIAAARDFPARHGAILLAWRAALVALTPPR